MDITIMNFLIKRAGSQTRVSRVVLLIVLLSILTSTSAKSNEQLLLNLTENIIHDGSFKKAVPLSPATGARNIAIQFAHEIKQMERKRSLEHHRQKNHNPQARQSGHYDILPDDAVDVLVDKPNKDATNISYVKPEVKATDYIFVSSRNGKSGESFSDSSSHYEESETKNEDGSSNQGLLAIVDSKPSTSVLPTFIINQPLHSRNRPQVTFEVTSDKVMYVFVISPEESSRSFISVVVEKMTCHENENNETGTPKLHIRGMTQEWSFCKDFDSSLNNYQTVDYMISGEKVVSIWGSEDWANSSALLVASIYTETSSCHFCPLTHFCCGRKESACKYTAMLASGKIRESSKSVNREHYKTAQQLQQQQRFRCIPKQDENGQSLLCNGHPNCGFHCNPDELDVNCPKEDGDDNGDGNNCPGQYCRENEQDRFMITLLLLILFCVFVPLCIFLFCCSRKEMRREIGRARGRCPLPLEIVFCPFSMNADDPPGSTTMQSTTTTTNLGSIPMNETESRMRGNMRRNFRRSEEVNSGRGVPPIGLENPNFFEDLPPPYSECCNDKTTFPNPLGPDLDSSSSSSRRNALMPGTSTFLMEPIIHRVPISNRRNVRTVGVSASTSQNPSMTTSLSLPATPTQVSTIASPSNETSQ